MADQRPNKQTAPGDDTTATLVVLGLVLGVLAVVGVAYGAAAITGHGAGGPAQWLFRPGPDGRWSTSATWWCLGFSLVAVLIGVWVIRMVRAGLKDRQWTDRLASSMSSRRDLDELRIENVAADTDRLGASVAGHGVSLGRSVLDRQWLYGTYEWCQVWIMGPRGGKTRSVAVPQIVEHGGAVVATSNKRDIVYLTRGPRSELGRIWIVDPQQIYREGLSCWWNPLAEVDSLERAEKLATIWRDSRTGGDVMGAEDPFFGPESMSLLTALIMAAALGRQPVTMVLTWLQNLGLLVPGQVDPAEILTGAGFRAAAADITSTAAMVAETRDGIVAGARSAVRWMRNPQFTQWVTQPADGQIPELRVEDFIRSTGTVYLLSKDGPGSARALVGSLTAAIWEAGRDLAEESDDRVRTPVLFSLDEAANIVRWGELPSLFSYSGSLGLILVVILQSAAQGEATWGRDGFRAMWSAANIAFVGRGLRDEGHLRELSQLIGDRQRVDHSRSVGKGHSSVSTSIREERILSEADLMALPRGRGVLFVAGSRAILMHLIDWSNRRDSSRIEASIEAFKAPWMEAADAADINAEVDRELVI